ncbi:REPS1 [Symbiodinium sp. CCMP2592]|nr:REPS1 [Symbiodinium sp. CCMP2592]
MHVTSSDDALWEPSTEELGDYKQLFLRLVGDADALLGAQGGKEVLERSGLPLTELAAIWYLADVDGDGQLALCEFACAMHLTARRRAGAVLPEELPSPLTRRSIRSFSTSIGRSSTASSVVMPTRSVQWKHRRFCSGRGFRTRSLRRSGSSVTWTRTESCASKSSLARSI